MNGDGEGAFSEAKSLMSSRAISDEETKDAHSVNFFFNVRNFPLQGKEYKISVLCVNKNLQSFTDKNKLETIIQEMSSKGFKRTEFIFKTIMKHFSDKKLRDNLKIHDLIEAISKATTRATIVYDNGDQLLSGIEQQFKKHTPQIMPEGGYKKNV
ncbi:uncharacterized protein LOC136032228 [Artemia franciscana]|uniref:uncharacterized protein LOC136032228 n=1 Tax=Artemia franciscana TaxID=6661 RepID=UPI0032DB9FB9